MYSPNDVQGLCESFKNRIAEAEEKIQTLVIYKRGRKRLKSLAELRARIGAIIKKYKVEDCFAIECWEEVLGKKVQRYKKRAPEIRKEIKLHLKLSRNEPYISDRTRKLGWQVYGTTC